MSRPDLSLGSAEARYEAERKQGELIASGHESAWGWSGAAGESRAERRASFLISAAGLGAGVTALELGAGTGEFTERLVESGCNLVAVELSPETAQLCRDRVGSRAEVVVGNIETGEGLEGRSFDAVVGVSVLHHVNLTACLEVIRSVLVDGGRAAFSEPNMANPQIWLERHSRLVKKWRHVTPHETAFRASELRREFERASFRVDVCEPFDFVHPATPRPLLPAVQAIGDLLERTPVRAIAGSVRLAATKS
jgi:SAM-dependent methyltransferase